MKRLSILASMLVVLCISWPFQGCSDEAYYHLAITAGTDGTITAPTTSLIAVKPGAATNIAAVPATDYQFLNWTVAVGTGVIFGDANIASTTVTLTEGNATIRANFTLIPYQLTAIAGGGGTISEPPSNTISVKPGVATTITATPSAGYGFVNWTVSTGTGVYIANMNSASTKVILTEGDAAIQANFTPTYQLTVSAIGGGTVIEPPSNTISIKSGFATTITATPSDGYSFVNWTISTGTGVNIANVYNATTTVTLTGGDAAIQANFTPNSYQLTVTAGTGGTITIPPSSPITVTYGVATNITALPNTHYGLVNWTETTNTGVTFGDANSTTTTVTLTGTGGDVVIQANFGTLIITVAGNGTNGYSGDNGQATSAELDYPAGVAVDSSGNIYIADGNDVIRKVDTSGIITTVAGGGAYLHIGDNGPATSAYLSDPTGITVDSSGNIYFADQGNERIRKVDTSGIITTVAGNGGYGYSGDGGQASSAMLCNPSDVEVDSSGNIYIADYSNNRIRKVDTSGIITTVAGSENYGYSGDGGPATFAALHFPNSVAVDSSGNLYIADTANNRIRKVDVTSKNITTVAGNGSNIYWGGYSGDGGPATSAQLNGPSDVAVDSSGNIYFVDAGNKRIRTVNTSGIITTVAGTGNVGYSGDNGPATSAWFWGPNRLAVDSSGNIYIVDSANQRIRMVYGP
jgi:Gluconolactonase